MQYYLFVFLCIIRIPIFVPPKQYGYRLTNKLEAVLFFFFRSVVRAGVNKPFCKCPYSKYFRFYEPYRLPTWYSGKEATCQCRRVRRHRFDPWVRKTPGEGNDSPLHILAWGIPWTMEPGGLYSPWHCIGLHNQDLATKHTCT